MVKEKKIQLGVGHKVFVINSKLEIEEKKILAVVQQEDKILYQLDTYHHLEEEELILTKNKAKVKLQNFLNDLKFRVGDLLIFKYKEYSRKSIEIGRVFELNYGPKPYHIKTAYSNIHDVQDGDVVIKVNNKYIEGFGNIKELSEEWANMKKELGLIERQIDSEHTKLEKDLVQSFKKQYRWGVGKRCPLFEDKFNYEDECYD